MKIKRLIVSTLLISTVALAQDNTQVQYVEGDGTHYVKISLKDISRIVCPVEIDSDPVYSKEKNIVLKRAGKNIFVKIQPKQYINQKTHEVISTEYPRGNREAIVKCGDDVFTLVLVPEDIPVQTIYLNTKIKKVEEVKEFEKSGDYESKLLELIKFAYLEKMPRGYKETKETEERQFLELDMNLRKRYVGYYYLIDEYLITAKKDLELDEALFIPYLDGVKAISLENLKLKKGQQTRMFVVRKNKI